MDTTDSLRKALNDYLSGWLPAYSEPDGPRGTVDEMAQHLADSLVEDVLAPVLEGLDAAEARGRAEALSKAADAWQRGAWANTPRHRDQVADRVGQAQYVTEWLRERAATTAQSEGDHHA